MTVYLPVIVSFSIGMTVFVLLRQRDTNPMISGAAAVFLSMALVVGYYAFILTTGRI